MAKLKLIILAAFFILLITMEVAIAAAEGEGNGKGMEKKDEEKEKKEKEKEKKQEKKEKEKEKKEKEKEKKKEKKEKEKDKKEKEKEKKAKRASRDEASNYKQLSPLPSGQERAFCLAQGSCYYKTLTCPAECAQRKPKKNKQQKGCFVDCSSKCEATCKYRKPNCDGYGSLCYDPRFVGGDGVMFYFHGAKGGNFAIVSDDNLQINAHFIGSRPHGRTRDYTWVQAISVMFETHTLVVAANRVSHWDDNVDSLMVQWDGETVSIPTGDDAEWKSNSEEREVQVERTDETNSVRVKVSRLLEVDIKVRPIGEEENRVHNYQLPAGDAFAHLETQFRFKNLTDLVEGVLGKTYRPDYVSPVKRGVPMPMMGGEDKYRIPSLFSPFCRVCRFQRSSGFAADEGILAQY